MPPESHKILKAWKCSGIPYVVPEKSVPQEASCLASAIYPNATGIDDFTELVRAKWNDLVKKQLQNIAPNPHKDVKSLRRWLRRQFESQGYSIIKVGKREYLVS